jgi:hypothetical protein
MDFLSYLEALVGQRVLVTVRYAFGTREN